MIQQSWPLTKVSDFCKVCKTHMYRTVTRKKLSFCDQKDTKAILHLSIIAVIITKIIEIITNTSALRFISHSPVFPAPLPPLLTWGLAGGHPTLFPFFLPNPFSSATSAFGLFGQESPPSAAYNNKPTLVTVSGSESIFVSERKKRNICGGEDECEKDQIRMKEWK